MLVAGSGDDLGEEEDDERTYVPEGWMLTWRKTVVQVCMNRNTRVSKQPSSLIISPQ